jgi:NADPH:quinone reductase-like Zn-dependent oxidoreductase
MKAAVIDRFGGPEVLHVEELQTPKAGPGEVLVKVLAALVNRLDHYIRQGDITSTLFFPHVLGMDAVGEVAAVGEDVTRFKVGERVIAMPGYPADPKEYNVRPAALASSFSFRGLQLPGSYAQYIVVPQEFVLRDTTGLPVEAVATLPVPLLTAISAVQIVGEVQAGNFVLVHAGGSATGLMSIQVARALGAKVATTVRSKESAELAAGAGADLVINTRDSDFNDAISKWTGGTGVDVAIDSLGGSTFEKTIDATKVRGIIVAMGFMSGTEVKFDIRKFFFAQKQIRGSLNADIEEFAGWLDRVRNGAIKPIVDSALPLNQADKAHERVAQNTAKGGVVLLPWA